jgi:hypothetical protein
MWYMHQFSAFSGGLAPHGLHPNSNPLKQISAWDRIGGPLNGEHISKPHYFSKSSPANCVVLHLSQFSRWIITALLAPLRQLQGSCRRLRCSGGDQTQRSKLGTNKQPMRALGNINRQYCNFLHIF